MLYLLWGLLNVGLFIFFISICFKATKLLREKAGVLSSIIFVFGLLSFIGHSNNDSDNKEQNSNQIKTWKFSSEDSLSTRATFTVDLEKTLVSTYILGIEYGKYQLQQVNIPISAYSSTSGFISGTNWKPIAISITRTSDNNKFKYRVDGVIEWQLLGATIYSQLKKYQGITSTK